MLVKRCSLLCRYCMIYGKLAFIIWNLNARAVLEQKIYQAPNLHSLATSRLDKVRHHVRDAFNALQGHVRFAPSEGYTWNYGADGVGNKRWRDAAEVAASEARQKRQTVAGGVGRTEAEVALNASLERLAAAFDTDPEAEALPEAPTAEASAPGASADTVT